MILVYPKRFQLNDGYRIMNHTRAISYRNLSIAPIQLLHSFSASYEKSYTCEYLIHEQKHSLHQVHLRYVLDVEQENQQFV